MVRTRLLLPPLREGALPLGTMVRRQQLTPSTDLSELITDRAAIHGDRPFLRHARNSRSLSFSGLAHAVAWWGAWLEGRGVGPGDRVALALADPLDLATVFLAVMANGRWVVPLDSGAPARSLIAAIEQLQPSIVISDRSGSATPVRTVELSDIYESGPDDNVGDLDGDPLKSDRGAGVLLCTSGTTGKPKAIELHQRQLLHTARTVADHHRLARDDVGFNPLPLFHVNAEVVGLMAPLWAGGEAVLDDRFHRTDFWDLMAFHHVTWINAVPTIIARLMPVRSSEVVPNTIRFVRSASAPLPVATLKRFEEATGIAVLETYGMTESAGQITANPLQGPRKPGSVGLPVGIDLRVVIDPSTEPGEPSGSGATPTDQHGGPVSTLPGEWGHVEIRGPSVGPLTRTSIGTGPDDGTGRTGGWLRTGDVGCLDEDGYLYLQGRSDDVINRGGEKVYPREIEEVILEDSRVVDAIVIGSNDESFGQVPEAFISIRGVVERCDIRLALSVGDQTLQRLAEALPRSKRPVALSVVPGLARTPTGKLLRSRHREVEGGVIVTLQGR